jgi:hypothetical protein
MMRHRKTIAGRLAPRAHRTVHPGACAGPGTVPNQVVNPPRPSPRQAIAVTVEGMRRALVIVVVAVGVLVALAGLLFALQGFGAGSGSPMSNTTTWSILGPIIALIGIAIAFAGWRGRKT